MTATPGMGMVHASQADLNRMARQCEETGLSLAQGMVQVVDKVESLGGGGMAGEAYRALYSVSDQLNDGLAQVLTALNNLADKMSNAASQYNIHDGDAAGEIRSAAEASGYGSSVTGILRG